MAKRKRLGNGAEAEAGPLNGSYHSMPMLNGAPWYAKVVIWFMIWFGYPVVMSMILFGVVIGYIPSPLLTWVRETREETRAVVQFMQGSTKLLRQVCRNTATNRAEQTACD